MRRRGVTLVELLMAVTIFGFTFGAMAALYLTGIRSFTRTNTDTVLATQNAQGMRRVSDTVREAMTLSLSTDGKTLTYVLPKYSTAVDPTTGEKEFIVPLETDGVTRTFTVSGTDLIDNSTGRILVRNIYATDPDKTSSQFNQTYAPFQLTTIGSRRGLTVNLITSETLGNDRRYVRMKTTVLLRNAQ